MEKRTIKVFKREFLDKSNYLLATSLGLVAALAWNEAVQSIFRTYYGNNGDTLNAKIVYAVVVTVIAVLVTLWISKVASKLKR